MIAGQVILAIAVLAVLTEWLCERFFGKYVKGQAMIYLSAVVGVVLCLLFRVDGIQLLSLPTPLWAPWVGQVVTGLIVGAGSNGVHRFFSQYLPEKD